MLLKFAIKDFFDDREFKQISKATMRSYVTVLDEFHKYCISNEISDISEITGQTVKSFLIHCQKEHDNNPTTINWKLRTLKIFFNYLEAIELYDKKSNPGSKVDYVKAYVNIEVLSDGQIKKLLTYFRRLKTRDKSFYAYRDCAIIITFMGTGMRLGELVNLRWSDVDLEKGHIIVCGKLRTQTSIPMAEKLRLELMEYQLVCRKHRKRLPEYVFITRDGVKMSTNAVQNIFKRVKTIMNFTNVRCCPYDLRHTFAHRFLMNGGDVFTLQQLLRHKSIAMTQRYLALWGTALKEQNEKYNPINNFDFL